MGNEHTQQLHTELYSAQEAPLRVCYYKDAARRLGLHKDKLHPVPRQPFLLQLAQFSSKINHAERAVNQLLSFQQLDSIFRKLHQSFTDLQHQLPLPQYQPQRSVRLIASLNTIRENPGKHGLGQWAQSVQEVPALLHLHQLGRCGFDLLERLRTAEVRDYDVKWVKRYVNSSGTVASYCVEGRFASEEDVLRRMVSKECPFLLSDEVRLAGGYWTAQLAVIWVLQGMK